MSSIRPEDRVSLCRYSYADQRQCRTPRSPHHPHFCYFHARRESQSVAADQLANDLSYFFSGQYISANDLCAALGRLISAVVRGDIKPRTASTIAYLAQTFIQAIQVAQKEYIYAFDAPKWGAEIRHNVSCNVERVNETAPEEQQQDKPANQNNPQNDESLESIPEPAPAPTEVSAEDSHSGESSDPCSWSAESSDSDEDLNDESPNAENSNDEDADEDPDEQLDSHDFVPTPEPVTPVEATLAKN